MVSKLRGKTVKTQDRCELLVFPWKVQRRAGHIRLDQLQPRQLLSFYINMEEDSAAALMTALDSESIQYRTIVLLLLNTGLRRGELCGLEWGDIDFEKSVLSVKRNSVYLPGKGIFTDTPKTKSSTWLARRTEIEARRPVESWRSALDYHRRRPHSSGHAEKLVYRFYIASQIAENYFAWPTSLPM